jgi:lysyl-tRNA synthetase, class II
MSETSSERNQIEARRAKHRDLAGAGSYPHRYERSHLAGQIRAAHGTLGPASETEERVSVAGRLMLHRSFGKLQFGTLRDSSGAIQLVVDEATAGPDVAGLFSNCDLGDWLGASGTVMTTKRGELSVRVSDLVVLQKSVRPLPDKWHGLVDIETRSRQRYLDLMVNEDALEVALTRIAVVSALRREFEARGFLEVETPILLHQATGATARPFVTFHNALGQTMYLRIATELFLKRLVVGGMDRVFEIGRIFRNEGIDSNHNPEFTMLEAYQAFADYRDIMSLVEEVVASVAEAAVGATEIVYQDRPISLRPPFRRMAMIDLVNAAVGEELSVDDPVGTWRGAAEGLDVEVEDWWSQGRILAEIYDRAVEHTIWEPTFVTRHPVEVSPLSRQSSDDPRFVDRFELVIAGAEYANAFSELNDPDEQRERFEAQVEARTAGDDQAHPVDEDFLLALEYGMPPTGGLGIGVDRLVMLLADQSHIRDVILFPTLRALDKEGEAH